MGFIKGYQCIDIIFESPNMTIHRALAPGESGGTVVLRVRKACNDTEAAGLLRRYRLNMQTNRSKLPVLECGLLNRSNVYSVFPDMGYKTLHQLKDIGLTSLILLHSISRIASDISKSRPNTNLKPGNILIHPTDPPRAADYDELVPTGRFDALCPENDLFLFAAPEVIAGASMHSRANTHEVLRRRHWELDEEDPDAQSTVFSLSAIVAWFLGGMIPSMQDAWALATNPALLATVDATLRIPRDISPELTAFLHRGLAVPEADPITSLNTFALEILKVPEALPIVENGSLSPTWINVISLDRETATEQEDEAAPQEGNAEANAVAIEPVAEPAERRRAVIDSLLPKDCSASGIRSELDKYVIGQDRGKLDLSVLVSIHLTWFQHENTIHRAPNAILFGSTGVGKTHSLRTIARYLRLPYAIVDATSLVPSGIVGMQVEDILKDLVAMAVSILTEAGVKRYSDDDLELARRGIIFIDEFDKLRKTGNRETDGDNEQIQRRLLKMVEGSTMTVGQRRHTDDAVIRHIDTSGILFIASGAFPGITSREITSQRPKALQRSMKTIDVIISHDVMTYGFVSELVARLTILVRFDDLDADKLLRILKSEILNPMIVWQNHFRYLMKELSATDEALALVAEQAAELNLGARGISQVLFPLLESIAFEFESSSQKSYILQVEDVVRGRRLGNG